MLPWLPHRIYVEASSPLEVRQSLPPSHSRACKLIVLLPPHEGSLLVMFKARKTLSTRSWVRIKNKRSVYNGDVGYVETSNESDAVVIVAPRQRPYDMPDQSGEKMEFDAQLARLTGLPLEPLLSSAGSEVGHTCGDQEFVHGLLRLHFLVEDLVHVELPHPDDIKYHMLANLDRPFIEETVHLFSAQFWREKDQVEIWEGGLKGKLATLSNVCWDERCATVLCEGDVLDYSLRELRRHFEAGDAVKIIAGPFSGEAGHVVDVRDGTVTLVVIQEDRTCNKVSPTYIVHSYTNKLHRSMCQNFFCKAIRKTTYFLAPLRLLVLVHRIHQFPKTKRYREIL